MAKLIATGAAQAISQIDTVTMSGTWASTETVTIKVGSKSVTYTCGSGETTSTVAAALVLLCQRSNDPEFREITWTVLSAVITATSTAGVPVTITTSDTAASGASAVSNVQAATGPNHWNNIANWSTGAVPTTADEVTIADKSIAFKYGLPTSLTLGKFQHLAGQVGLPDFNVSGYPEYRATRAIFTCTDVVIGISQGVGPLLSRLDLASGAAIVAVYGSGQQQSLEKAAVDLLLNNAAAVVSIVSGQVAICPGADETTEVATVRVAVGAIVLIGEGTTLATLLTAGNTTLQADATTVTIEDGICTLMGGAVVTNLVVQGGTCMHKTSGTITDAVIGPGTLDCSQDIRPRTITDLELKKGANYRDAYRSITVTNGIVQGSDVDIITAG